MLAKHFCVVCQRVTKWREVRRNIIQCKRCKRALKRTAW